MVDRDDILLAMAREAGADTSMRSIWPPTFKRSISFTPQQLKHFAALVANQACEVCAQEFDRREARAPGVGFYDPEEPAQIIRALIGGQHG